MRKTTKTPPAAFGRRTRLKRLQASPLFEAFNLLSLQPQTAEVERKKAELLQQITIALRADTKTDASSVMLLPNPGTALEKLLADFQSHSSIPLPIAFWTFMSLLSQKLAQSGAVIVMRDGKEIIPILYTLILADSGECKTWTLNKIRDLMGLKLDLLPVPKSAEGLLQNLQEEDGKPMLMELDEAGKEHRRWSQDPNASRILSILLTSYTQEPIKLRLKRETYEILKPIISLLWYSQTKLFSEHFDAEALLSGLMQRFTVVFAMQRAGWEECLMLDELGVQLDKGNAKTGKSTRDSIREWMERVTIHDRYTMSVSAVETAKARLAKLARDYRLDKGFILRALYNSFKYALLFHVIDEVEGSEIQKEQMETALSLVAITLADLRHMLDEGEKNELFAIFQKALDTRARLEKGEIGRGEKWSESVMSAYVRGINTTNLKTVFNLVEAEWMVMGGLAGWEAEKAAAATPEPKKETK